MSPRAPSPQVRRVLIAHLGPDETRGPAPCVYVTKIDPVSNGTSEWERNPTWRIEVCGHFVERDAELIVSAIRAACSRSDALNLSPGEERALRGSKS